MIRFFLLFLFLTSLFASEVHRFRWANKETYLVFLQNKNNKKKRIINISLV